MIALSLITDTSEPSLGSSFQNTSYVKPFMSNNATMMNSEKQKPSNFFEDVGIAFSTLGSLFNFLN